MSENSSTYDLFSPAFFADPNPTFPRLRAEAPVYKHPQMGIWCLTRHADIQMLARDPRFSVERVDDQFGVGASPAVMKQRDHVNRFLSHWMVFADPPRHTRIRSLVARAFTPQAVEQLRPEAERIVHRCLDAALPSGKMDIVRDLAYVLPAEIIANMLGVPLDKVDAFKAWTADLLTLLGAGTPNEEVIRNAHAGVLGLEDLFTGLIAERRRTPGTDILSALVLAEESGSMLSDDEIISTAALVLMAGFETTTHLIGNAVLALLQHPEQLAKLRAQPNLLPGAVEELARFDGAVLQIARRTLEDVDFGGTVIPAGQLIFGFLPAANRDPAVYPNPDVLDIERPGLRTLAFGYGIHVCLGAAIARMEIHVALDAILKRLPNLALTTTNVERVPSIAIRGCVAVPVVFDAPNASN